MGIKIIWEAIHEYWIIFGTVVLQLVRILNIWVCKKRMYEI